MSGPGSRRGLNRVLGRAVDEKWWSEGAWLAAFQRLREAITPALAGVGIVLDAQDLQNCLCELDKWERARGGSKLKRRFRPSPDPLP